MVAGQNTDYLFVRIQNRIAGFSVLQYQFLDLIHTILKMEAGQIFCSADTSDRSRLENQTGGSVGIIRCGYNAGCGRDIIELFIQLSSAENQTVYVHLQSITDNVRLIAADGDGVFSGEQGRGPAFRHCDNHFTGNCIGIFTDIVQYFSFNYRQNIKERNFFKNAGIGQFHVIACNIFSGQHAEETSVIVCNRNCRNTLLFPQNIPGSLLSNGCTKNWGCVIVQILDLGIHISDYFGGLKTEMIQHDLCFVRYTAQTGCFIFAIAKSISQRCIGNGGYNRIRIWILMTGYINWIHKISP